MTETFLDLKAQLEAITKVAIDKQRLLFNGALMADEQTLKDGNVENDAVLHLVYRIGDSDEWEEVRIQ